MTCLPTHTMSAKQIQLDVHTHTLASGHAYSTVTEMAKAASEKGLKLLGITEHAKGIPGTCQDIYFANMEVIPRHMFGIELVMGSEINILDYEGNLSLSDRYIDYLDIRIAGIHPHCYQAGTGRQNTDAILGAIKNPRIDIISHPDDGRLNLDFEELVLASKEYHTLLEVNNSSLQSPNRLNVRENVLEILRLCKKYQVPVIADSDAHFATEVGEIPVSLEVLKEADFPDELVMNYDLEKFKAFLAANRRAQ